MSSYHRAIKLTSKNHDQIVRDTPLSSETVYDMIATSPYAVVVKTPQNAYYVVPTTCIVTFGFGEFTNPETGWYNIVFKA
jgi:3-polyprenyl-4-hydroxybenzoate decarboxylase